MMQKFLKSVPFWAVPRMLTSGNIGLGHDIGAFFPVLMALLGPRKNPGPRLNIKTVLSTYGDFHVKDKTAVRTSYL